ncbi:maleylacetate reductase [Segnochrobactrum spirostomi]|uniref:Maleylacetate reductase n=1 Tax=Segnochrobactrum spirostomi TaxID=2608987 RepID=A0A6A7YCB0_9HYPH|nr:maleylacetate reductase [Segnochrobactrum spirostomi]MQT15598.1 maleylacetate reductase [Segnochrobactrum spirostomi]
MMESFVFPGLTTRVVFGRGTTARAGDEARRLGHSKVLVLSTPHQKADAERLAEGLGDLAAGIFAGAVMHTPVAVTEEAVAAFRASGATAVVSLGGGSTTGLGKAIAVRTGADQVVIPTTYAGSEMTDILGETADGEKTTRRSPDIRPETVIYDVDLTLSLPVKLTVTSAMNAIAHAMEAFYAPDRNPVIELMCRDATAAFHACIPTLIKDPMNAAARGRALYGAWCCSTALGYVQMALHHKLAHVFGGSFDTPHAETHAILLPYTTAFNEVAVPDLLAPIAEAFGGGSAGGGLWDFAQSVGSPLSLKEIGIAESDLDRAAAIAVKNAYANPRPIEATSIRELLQAAWEGRRPGA